MCLGLSCFHLHLFQKPCELITTISPVDIARNSGRIFMWAGAQLPGLNVIVNYTALCWTFVLDTPGLSVCCIWKAWCCVHLTVSNPSVSGLEAQHPKGFGTDWCPDSWRGVVSCRASFTMPKGQKSVRNTLDTWHARAADSCLLCGV